MSFSPAKPSKSTYSSRLNALRDVQGLLVITCPNGRGETGLIVVGNVDSIISVFGSNDDECGAEGFCRGGSAITVRMLEMPWHTLIVNVLVGLDIVQNDGKICTRAILDLLVFNRLDCQTLCALAERIVYETVHLFYTELAGQFHVTQSG